MGKYQMDMRQEKERGNLVLDSGWYNWEIIEVEQQTSKKGNEMFKILLALANEPNKTMEVYAISTQGKRWFLKSLLLACEAPAAEDGVYDWSEEDILGKTVQGRIENIDETWIDRNGNERNTTKSKIVEFRKIQVE